MPDIRYKIRSCFSVIILISMLLLLSSCGHFRIGGFFGKRSLKNAILWAKQDSTRIADSLRRIQVKSKADSQIDKEQVAKPLKENIPRIKSGKGYYIIVGSFSSNENAKLRAREYFTKGYKTEIIAGTGSSGATIELVSVRSFENISEAKSFLKEFQHDIDPTAWLYSNN
jgi:hypothetical protein